ncbi:hypothetical protein ENUP19_0121G0020 [Entamoeba nuttalli]
MNLSLLESLKQWTNCTQFQIIYDTRVEEFTIQQIQRILYGKDNIVLLIQTVENDLFGTYHSQIPTKRIVQQPQQFSNWIGKSDENIFLFSLNNHNSPNNPLKFLSKALTETCLCLNTNESHFEIVLWISYCINLLKPLNSSKSFVFHSIKDYFYVNSPDDLLGKPNFMSTFIPKRFLILQGN